MDQEPVHQRLGPLQHIASGPQQLLSLTHPTVGTTQQTLDTGNPEPNGMNRTPLVGGSRFLSPFTLTMKAPQWG